MLAEATSHSPAATRAQGWLWLVLAVLALSSVLILNGRPLFYFDTIGYVEQGRAALTDLGLIEPAPVAEPAATGTDGSTGTDEGTGGSAAPAPRTVDGSRSAVYAILAGMLAHLGVLEALLPLNVLAVLVAVWLPMRVARRRWGGLAPVAKLVAWPVIAAAAGSLPFYVAYLMPDTFAPVLIIVAATLAVFGRDMRWGEVALALALGGLAVTSHLSHLAIAALMVPAALFFAPLLSRRRWWLPPLLVLVIPLIGIVEQRALRVTARVVSKSEVVIKPFITARLIQDGPGLAYLERHCPDAAIATCALYAALSKSDNPRRFTSSHIIFQTSADLGSFRLMDLASQKAVSDSQTGFFRAVLTEAPVDTMLAILGNTVIQAGMVSVDMTLPTASMIRRHEGVTGLLSGRFAAGRITAGTGWLDVVTPLHEGYYLLSLLIIVALVAVPGRVPAEIRALAVLLLLGILANAVVCGGISQPATRYGARVIWLLPLAAMILILFAWPRRPGGRDGEGRP